MTQSLSFVTGISPSEHDAFVSTQPTANLLQSATWAQVKQEWSSELVGVRDDDGALVASALVLKRPLKFGFTMWYLPHGPILDYRRRDVLSAFLAGLKKHARSLSCVFVRVDPPVAVKAARPDELPETRDSHALAIGKELEDAGFKHQGFVENLHDSLQPRFMAVTMNDDGAPLRDRVMKKTKTWVKTATKKGVTVERRGPEAIDDFLGVLSMTEEAKGISLRNKEYFENIASVYGDDAHFYIAELNVAKLLADTDAEIADYQARMDALPEGAPKKRRLIQVELDRLQNKRADVVGQHERYGDRVVLAGALNIRYADGYEMLYAGMNRDFPQLYAQYLNQIVAIEEAFSDGARYSNMGGVEGSLDDGLFMYKSRFDPIIVEKLGEFDHVVNPPLYALVKAYLARR